MHHIFGTIFGEEISVSKIQRKKRVLYDDLVDNPRSPWPFAVILILGFSLLLARLFEITLMRGDRLRQLSVNNRIREEKISAPRGIIYDRDLVQLVRNIPVFTSLDGKRYFEQMPSTDSAAFSESITRQYIGGEVFGHVTGFVGEVSDSEKYGPGEVVGKMGVEEYYDDYLRGIDGKKLQEVDAMGSRVRVLGKIEPVSGRPLTLTVSSRLQKVAALSLVGQKGAVIATNPQTGEVLSLYSSPSFDPNEFITGQNAQKILENTDQPLFNRTIAGKYPPGSTFKIVTALAGLESGIISKETKIEDTGILTVNQFSFGNWYFLQYGKKEGFLDIIGALKRSNDIFFYKTGEMVGIDKIAQMARKVGMGELAKIDVPGEDVGVVADPLWREQVKQEKWYLGDTFHVAIGQGDLLATPLEVNRWTNVIAMDGKLCRPYIVKDQNTRFRGTRSKAQSDCKDVGLKKENIEIIREGMRQACETGGTGWPLFKFKVPASPAGGQSSKIKTDGIDFFESVESSSSGKYIEIPVACKTGTSEYGNALGKTHAWFTVFAPIHNPQISISVLVEGGGEGSNVAAPIAKKMLEEWFERS